jgi:hypothetical protein
MAAAKLFIQDKFNIGPKFMNLLEQEHSLEHPVSSVRQIT